MLKEKPIRILIVEDDFLVAKELQRIFMHLGGYEILGVANNGEQALEMVGSFLPHVVLLDLQIPKIHGLEVAKKIQERYPTPIVILTAHESEELLEKAVATGIGAYLTKPADPLTIQRAIIIAMARHKDLMQLYRLYQELEIQKKQLEKAMAELKVLRGIIPICANCKKIRNDSGYWEQVETYIEGHTTAEFTHGICPECFHQLYPEYAKIILKEEPGRPSLDGARKTKKIPVVKLADSPRG